MKSIQTVDLTKTKPDQFSAHLADCVILTKDNKILMQQRPENWGKHAGVLNIFGGHVEEGETVLEGLIRELHEVIRAYLANSPVFQKGMLLFDLKKEIHALACPE